MSAAGLPFRAVIALAALGMVVSALILLGEAGANIVGAARGMFGHGHDQKAISLVMKTIDECLFAIILILLAAKVLASFVFSEAAAVSRSLPSWVRPSDMGELKSTFCQAILVYLIVDFATDTATVESKLDPGYLVMPVAILIIAGALKLMPHGEPASHPAGRTHDG